MRGLRRGDQPEAARQRLRKLAVATCAAAAILLSLSVGASAARPDPPSTLVLEQTLDGVAECVSPDGACNSVNLYGQDGQPSEPLDAPGQHRTTTVGLRNAGTLAASDLVMSVGTCRNERLDDLGPPDGDLCGTVVVTIRCSTGGTTFSLGPTTLTAFGQSGTHVINGGLAPGASTTCTFTVLYPVNGPILPFFRAIQPISWTLSAEEAAPTTSAPATTPTPTTTPSAVAPAPSAPTTPPRAPGTPPATVAPPSLEATPPGGLAATGIDAMVTAIAGLVLLAVGGVLFWLSRRRDRNIAGEYRPAPDSPSPPGAD